MHFTPMTAFDVGASKQRCKKFRHRILGISQHTPLHVAPSFSCIEMLEVIYFSLMRRQADGALLDTFILSKGHGAAAQYVALEELGILPSEELDRMCLAGSCLGTHPDYGVPGIAASTGSLGHGLALGLGMSLADKLQSIDRTVYVVLSDGELQEGSVWEALMLAPSLGVTNLVAFVDLNDQQSLGQTSKTLPNFYPIVDKIRAFGWEAVELDGHNTAAMWSSVQTRGNKAPFLVLGKTTKGKGVSYMENVPIWHYRSPSPDEYRQAVREIEEAA